jgi:hypothetical protein
MGAVESYPIGDEGDDPATNLRHDLQRLPSTSRTQQQTRPCYDSLKLTILIYSLDQVYNMSDCATLPFLVHEDRSLYLEHARNIGRAYRK